MFHEQNQITDISYPFFPITYVQSIKEYDAECWDRDDGLDKSSAKLCEQIKSMMDIIRSIGFTFFLATISRDYFVVKVAKSSEYLGRFHG